MIIQISRDETAQGLAKLRELAQAEDMLKVLANDMQRYVVHLGALYRVPDGYQIRDWTVGFEQVQEAGNGDNDGKQPDGTDVG